MPQVPDASSLRHVRWLLLLFIVVPLLELYLLVWLGGAIGFWPTLALTIISGILGGALARHEGLRVLREWRSALERMELPAEGVIDGLMVLVGAAFLIAPGVLTDLAGALLLIRPTRRLIGGHIRRALERRLGAGAFGLGRTAGQREEPWVVRAQGGESDAREIVTTSGEAVVDPPPAIEGGSRTRTETE